MQIQRQPDLLGDRHHGVQRGSRILEHHTHITPAQIGHGGIVRHADQLFAADHDRHRLSPVPYRAATPSWRLAIMDLPDPEEPTRPTRSPSAMPKCTHRRTMGLPYQWRCSDPTNFNAHAASLSSGLVNGSMASRSASPNRCNATTAMVTTRPGHRTASGIDADEFHGRGRANAPNWARRRLRRHQDRSAPPRPVSMFPRSSTTARSSTGITFGMICLTNTRMPELASEPYRRFNILPNARRVRAAGSLRYAPDSVRRRNPHAATITAAEAPNGTDSINAISTVGMEISASATTTDVDRERTGTRYHGRDQQPVRIRRPRR